MTSGPDRILVIATAGLARFALGLGAMASIRAYHATATIVLLTATATTAFATTSPYFSEVWTDDAGFDPAALLNLRRRLRAQPFDRVYDLDANKHSKFLFWLMHGWRSRDKRASLAWSGTIPGTALAYADPRREAMHVIDHWAVQLKAAGITALLRPDLSWVARHVKTFVMPFRMTEPFALVVLSAGTAWNRQIAELAAALETEGHRVVFVGENREPSLQSVINICPKAVDLVGRITLNEIVLLAWAADGAIGPVSGIMHLAAAAGCRCIVLYDGGSDPARDGPRGSAVTVLRRPNAADIPAGEVMAALKRAGSHKR